jgi:hypothetical protein
MNTLSSEINTGASTALKEIIAQLERRSPGIERALSALRELRELVHFAEVR